MTVRAGVAAAGIVAVLTRVPSFAQPAVVLSNLALDARAVRAARTPAGYELSGQAEVNDACQTARFTRVGGTAAEPLFAMVQYRRRDRRGFLCIQNLQWVYAQPLSVTTKPRPRRVGVHTMHGIVRTAVR